MKFGERIFEIRQNSDKTLKYVSNNLRLVSLTKYSKIERGIQNPTQEEFSDIIRALDIQDNNLINELYELSREDIPVKVMTEAEIMKEMPLIFDPNVEVIEELIEKFRKMIIEKFRKMMIEKIRKMMIENYTPEEQDEY